MGRAEIHQSLKALRQVPNPAPGRISCGSHVRPGRQICGCVMRTESTRRPARRRATRAKKKRRAKFLKNALRFIERGIPVFPVAENSKIPLTTHGFKDATTDPRQIEDWVEEHPQANIGIPTGSASGFVVIDLDRKGGVDGVKGFTSLCHRLHIEIPDTYKIKTPSGGRHLFFRTKRAGLIRNSAGILGPGIDVRGEGGYVVAEGSVIDGKRYKCIGGSLDDIATLPKKLRDESKSAKKRRRGINGHGTYEVGCRNESLFRDAREFMRNGCSFDRTLDLVRRLNESACKPPLDDDEVVRIVESASSYKDPQQPNDTLDTALTEYGDAVRMARTNEGLLIYIHETKKFYCREKREHWRHEPGKEMVLAKNEIRQLQEEVPKIDDLRTQDAVSKHAIKGQSSRALHACVGLVTTEPETSRSITQFDTDPWSLAVPNGVVSLRDRIEFRPVEADDHFLKVAATKYDAEAECPTWLSFLELVQPNRVMRRYLQKLVGLTLVGSAAQEIIIFLYGVAGSGKSTLVNTVMCALGRDLAVKIPISVLLMRNREGSANELLPLLGARMAVASEVPEGRKFNEAQLKDLASRDPLATRPPYAEQIQFEPSHTLWIYGNHLARVSGSDTGIERRMHLLPFDQVIPAAKIDRFFDKKLEAELPGILNWALEGCVAWQREDLKKPRRVQKATTGYLTEMDLIKQFIDQRIINCPGEDERASAVYSAYGEWAIGQGERPVSNTKFGTAAVERGIRRLKRKKGNFYLDIKVLRHGE